jgi:hypothetical protein
MKFEFIGMQDRVAAVLTNHMHALQGTRGVD